MKALLLVLTLVLVQCHRGENLPAPTLPIPTRSPADIVGNGGDNVQVLFEQARTHLVQAFPKLQPHHFDLAHLLDSERLWFDEQLLQLKTEIHTANLEWNKHPPEGACTSHSCGCYLASHEVIYLNRQTCSERIHTVEEATNTLLHEMGHRFWGPDEDKANRFAVAVQLAIRQTKGKRFSIRPIPSTIIPCSGFSVFSHPQGMVIECPGKDRLLFSTEEWEWKSISVSGALPDSQQPEAIYQHQEILGSGLQPNGGTYNYSTYSSLPLNSNLFFVYDQLAIFSIGPKSMAIFNHENRTWSLPQGQFSLPRFVPVWHENQLCFVFHGGQVLTAYRPQTGWSEIPGQFRELGIGVTVSFRSHWAFGTPDGILVFNDQREGWLVSP